MPLPFESAEYRFPGYMVKITPEAADKYGYELYSTTETEPIAAEGDWANYKMCRDEAFQKLIDHSGEIITFLEYLQD